MSYNFNNNDFFAEEIRKGAGERAQAVLAMEYLARQINDEDVFMGWLYTGPADGDIPYGATSPAGLDMDYYIEPDNFRDLLDLFLRLMSKARNSGGLYCGGVVGGEMSDEDKQVNGTRKAWRVLSLVDEYIDDLRREHLFATPADIAKRAEEHISCISSLPDDLKGYVNEIVGKICDLAGRAE